MLGWYHFSDFVSRPLDDIDSFPPLPPSILHRDKATGFLWDSDSSHFSTKDSSPIFALVLVGLLFKLPCHLYGHQQTYCERNPRVRLRFFSTNSWTLQKEILWSRGFPPPEKMNYVIPFLSTITVPGVRLLSSTAGSCGYRP